MTCSWATGKPVRDIGATKANRPCRLPPPAQILWARWAESTRQVLSEYRKEKGVPHVKIFAGSPTLRLPKCRDGRPLGRAELCDGLALGPDEYAPLRVRRKLWGRAAYGLCNLWQNDRVKRLGRQTGACTTSLRTVKKCMTA